MNPHQVTRDFEKAVADYTGAPYVVAVNSCTAALTLAVAWHLRDERKYIEGPIINGTICRAPIEIPKHTYVSVPQAIIHAGGRPTFRDESWAGWYQLKPLAVWNSARWFTKNMYNVIDSSGARRMLPPSAMVCTSFHASKTLGDSQGGAILHDNPEADAWMRRARFDGRTEGVAPKDDHFDMVGWHCYMSPDVAARLLHKLSVLPSRNAPLPNDDYPDLNKFKVFQ